MIVTMEMPADSQQLIARHAQTADEAAAYFARGLLAAAVAGAEEVVLGLMTGRYGLMMRNPGQGGLAACVMGWMLDETAPLAAIGVPANTPAAAYAAAQEFGATITPKNAKRLAVPVSEEARQYSSPRDMQGLELLPRPGRPPLLVRLLRQQGAATAMEIHWVLLASVTIPARPWLAPGVEDAAPVMAGAFEGVLGELAARWNEGRNG